MPSNDRTGECLELIEKLVVETGSFPPLERIAEGMGLVGRSAGYYWVHKLVDQESVVLVDNNGPRCFKLKDGPAEILKDACLMLGKSPEEEAILRRAERFHRHEAKNKRVR